MMILFCRRVPQKLAPQCRFHNIIGVIQPLLRYCQFNDVMSEHLLYVLVDNWKLSSWMTLQLPKVKWVVAGIYTVLQNTSLTNVEL